MRTILEMDFNRAAEALLTERNSFLPGRQEADLCGCLSGSHNAWKQVAISLLNFTIQPEH